MKVRKSGHMLNIASIAGDQPAPYIAAYVAAYVVAYVVAYVASKSDVLHFPDALP